MKIKILSPSENWKPVIDEVQKIGHFLAGSKDFSVDFFTMQHIPTEEYKDGRYGLDRKYLKALASVYKEDIVIFHIPDFPVQGAIGWIVHSKKPTIQLYKDHLREYSRSGEFKYRTAETIVHELCHYYYKKFGIKDNTHYFHYEKGSLLLAVKDIKKHLLKEKIGLLEQVVRLLRKSMPTPKTEEPQEYWCVHHSATLKATTRPETIERRSRALYGGKPFYDAILDVWGDIYYYDAIEKSRGTKDLCVLGNFISEEPSSPQIEALTNFLKDKDYTTHKELAEKGLATISECPGNLMNFIEMP